MKKRALSLLLAAAMLLSICPVSAFADDTGGGIFRALFASAQSLAQAASANVVKVEVSTGEEFMQAVKNFNDPLDNSGLGTDITDYQVILQNDITLTPTDDFFLTAPVNIISISGRNSSFTIYGNHHTITYGGSTIGSDWFSARCPLNLHDVTLKCAATPSRTDVGCSIVSTSVNGPASTENVSVSMYNCTIDGGNGGLRGVAVNASNASGTQSALTMVNSCIQNCTSSTVISIKHDRTTYNAGAAGVFMGQETYFSMTNSTIQNCTASTGLGGGVYMDENTFFNITGSTIQNCSAPHGDGAGIYQYLNDSSNYSSITDSRIENCTALGNGGGAYFETSLKSANNTITFSNTTITDCSGWGGGGLYGCNLKLINCHITNCTSERGGGIYFRNILTLTDGSSITGCHAMHGGGVYGSHYDTDNSYYHTPFALYASDGLVVNNTASNVPGYTGWGGSDLSIGSSCTVYLPSNIQEQNVIYQADGKGRRIDGWYYDDSQSASYDRTKHVDAAATVSKGTNLVASYNVYDIVFDGTNKANCTAYNTAAYADTDAIAAAYKDDVVYLVYSGTADDNSGAVDENTQIGWKATTDDGTVVAVTPATADTPAHFSLPDKPYCKKVTITPVVEYKLDVTGGTAYAITDTQHTTPLAWAKEGDLITLVADADTEDAKFANWVTSNDENTSLKYVNGSVYTTATFTMPAAPVTVGTQQQYHITAVNGTASAEYAEPGTQITITATAQDAAPGVNTAFAGWETESTGVTLANSASRETSFEMPGNAVTVTAAEKYKVTVQGGTATGIDEQGYAKAGTRITLAYTGTGADESLFGSWVAESAIPGGIEYETGADAQPGQAHFIMPAKPVTLTPTAEYVLNIVGGFAYKAGDAAKTPIKQAQPGDSIQIEADAPADTAGEATAFANWQAAGVTLAEDAPRETGFEMPANPVSITAVEKYKVTVQGGTATGPDAMGYAKENTPITLAYTGTDTFVKWVCSELTDEISADSFTMPGHAVTITAQTDKLYDITVSLPADAAFAPDAAPVAVTVEGTPAARANAGQPVALAFDAATLPEGKLFDAWQVTTADDTVEVGADGTFTMPAADVTVSFTLKEIPTVPEEPDTPANPDTPGTDDTPDVPDVPDVPDAAPADGAGGAAALVVGAAAVGGAAYLIGTQVWMEANLPGGVIPTSRQQLAELLWTAAGKPEPAPAALYTDIAAAETEAQQAARWCVQQGLLQDYGERFQPGTYTFRPQVIKAWNQLQQQLSAQPAAEEAQT